MTTERPIEESDKAPEWYARGFRRRCDLQPGQELLRAELEIERLEGVCRDQVTRCPKCEKPIES